jgi:hypothetical protein
MGDLNMALVQFGELVIGVRGTIGGMTLSANGSGAYAKRWAQPPKSASVKQVEKRGWMSQVRADWRQCTEAQIAAWDALAADPPEIDYNPWGEQIYLSGSAWHTRINIRRLQCGQSIERDAPANSPIEAPATFGLTIYDFEDEVSDSTFNYTENDFTDLFAILYCSPSTSQARQVQTTGYLIVWADETEGATSTRINEELADAFGWLSAGQKIFGRLHKQRPSGIRSTYITTTTIIQEPA